jgi:hypothetical protein
MLADYKLLAAFCNFDLILITGSNRYNNQQKSLTMKLKSLFLFSLASLCLSASFAQTKSYPSFSLTVPLAYTFDETAVDNSFELQVKGNFQYGVTGEFFTSKRSSVELSYLRQGTDITFVSATGNELNPKDKEGSVNYVLLGGNAYFPKSGANATPFVGGGLGVGIVNVLGGSSTNFGFNAKAGIKIATAKALSFKLNAYVQSATTTFGSEYWVSSGGTVGVYPDRMWLFQFGLGGAVCFDFKGK